MARAIPNRGRQQSARGQIATTSRNKPTPQASFSFPNRTEKLANVVMPVGLPFEYNCLLNPTKLPWLSTISPAFDMFTFSNLWFEYKPSCPTTTTGSTCMFIDYDPTDTNSGSMDVMSASGGASTQNIYLPNQVRYRPVNTVSPSHKYYVDAGSNPDRLSHPGRFWFKAESGVAAETVVGAIYVHYSVTFLDPQPVGVMYPKTLRVSAKNQLVGTGDYQTVLGKVTEVIATGSTFASAVNQAVNSAVNLVKLVGGYFQDAPAVAATRDLTHPDFVGHIYSDVGVVTVASTAFDTQWPNTSVVVYETTAKELLAVIQVHGTYTPAGAADRFGLQTHCSTGWDLVSYEYKRGCEDGVIAANIGVATTTYVLYVYHFKRTTATGPFFWCQFRGTCTNPGTITTCVASDFMISDYPNDLTTVKRAW